MNLSLAAKYPEESLILYVAQAATVRFTTMVDENRIKGAAQDVAGKLEESVGGSLGDRETQAAGKARQVAGQAQNAYGRTADQARHAGEKVGQAAAEQPLLVFFITLAIGFFFGRMSVRR